MRRNAAGQLVTAVLRTASSTVATVNSGATMTVVKDGTMSAGAGTLTYIGSGTAIGSTAGAVTGVWKYAPTAGETNASAVSFLFGSATANTVVVEKFFEPTSGPILYQALLSATGGAVTNQTTIVLPSATPIPAADDDAYNGCEIVFYDGSTAGQVSVGVVLDYVGSTRTITLREAPTFTVTTSDYVTIIADPSLKPATANRNLVVDANGRVDVTSNIKKNQALAKFMFLMTDSTNHAPATGKTVTVTRSIDGAAFGAGGLSAVTELSDGLYGVDFAAADLNGNVVMLKATAAACDVTFERIITQQ